MNVNRHHICYDRLSWIRDSLATKIRQHPGLIIPLDVNVHKELHKEIKPITPPIRSLSNLILTRVANMRDEPLINLLNISQYTLELADYDNGRLGDDAFRVGSFFVQQAGFLAENQHSIRTRDEL